MQTPTALPPKNPPRSLIDNEQDKIASRFALRASFLSVGIVKPFLTIGRYCLGARRAVRANDALPDGRASAPLATLSWATIHPCVA